MELINPWLQVIPISGPDHMIVKTARVLRERGAPDRLIHYDLAPEADEPD